MADRRRRPDALQAARLLGPTGDDDRGQRRRLGELAEPRPRDHLAGAGGRPAVPAGQPSRVNGRQYGSTSNGGSSRTNVTASARYCQPARTSRDARVVLPRAVRAGQHDRAPVSGDGGGPQREPAGPASAQREGVDLGDELDAHRLVRHGRSLRPPDPAHRPRCRQPRLGLALGPDHDGVGRRIGAAQVVQVRLHLGRKLVPVRLDDDGLRGGAKRADRHPLNAVVGALRPHSCQHASLSPRRQRRPRGPGARRSGRREPPPADAKTASRSRRTAVGCRRAGGAR